MVLTREFAPESSRRNRRLWKILLYIFKSLQALFSELLMLKCSTDRIRTHRLDLVLFPR